MFIELTIDVIEFICSNVEQGGSSDKLFASQALEEIWGLKWAL